MYYVVPGIDHMIKQKQKINTPAELSILLLQAILLCTSYLTTPGTLLLYSTLHLHDS